LQNTARGKRRGILGTTIVHLMLFGMLILVGFSTPPAPDTEGGILVNFGTGETGIGDIEPSPPAFKEENSAPPVKELATPPQSASKPVVKPAEDPLLSQNTEEAPVVKKTPPVIKKVDPEAAKKRLEKIEADKKLNEQLEAERVRVREEEAEKKRIAAEQKRESDIMNRTKNALANSQNRGTTSTGEGVAGGPGNQGDPNGSIDSRVRGTGSGLGTSGTGTGAGTGTGDKGISYNLGGREIQSLPRPKYDYQTEGKVVVDVSVDRSGKVVQAVPGGKGSSTLNDDLLRIAKEAAMGAKFKVKQDAPPIQKGTITYIFILKQ
jgi:outer membrane biosynthesis protein TonB